VWLLDAALQYQPFMFGRGFAVQVIEPAAAGNPAAIARPMVWGAHVIAAHPVLWNALFATVQLALALGLFRRRTVKLALAGTVGWSLGVWWLGEGLGGIFSGAGPVAGAPGAALLYALLAVLLWPGGAEAGSVARSSIARGAAADVWIAVVATEGILALPVAHARVGVAAGLALALVAAAPRVPRLPARALLTAAFVGAALLWALGQHFGSILGGDATDPNSGPLLALLTLAYWPLDPSMEALRRAT
jgi:hypothetical protein